ncbi:hypothetical protein [Streptomyces sp. NPDC059639]|uniref:hypothetical protein n=1 Tax=Streptomyces sp. NPDC059639 TaxID=3346891 RepID=UPI00369BC445
MPHGTTDEEAARRYPFPQPAALEAPAEWARMRQECPVARVTLPSGDEATLLTRYDHVRSALSDPRLSHEGAADEDAARVAEGDIFNSPMARTEMQTVLEVLLRRLPGLELAVEQGELRQVEGLLTGPLRELPVTW